MNNILHGIHPGIPAGEQPNIVRPDGSPILTKKQLREMNQKRKVKVTPHIFYEPRVKSIVFVTKVEEEDPRTKVWRHVISLPMTIGGVRKLLADMEQAEKQWQDQNQEGGEHGAGRETERHSGLSDCPAPEETSGPKPA